MIPQKTSSKFQHRKKYLTSTGEEMVFYQATGGRLCLAKTRGSFATEDIELIIYNFGNLSELPEDEEGRIAIQGEAPIQVTSYALMDDMRKRRIIGRQIYHALRDSLKQEAQN